MNVCVCVCVCMCVCVCGDDGTEHRGRGSTRYTNKVKAPRQMIRECTSCNFSASHVDTAFLPPRTPHTRPQQPHMRQSSFHIVAAAQSTARRRKRGGRRRARGSRRCTVELQRVEQSYNIGGRQRLRRFRRGKLRCGRRGSRERHTRGRLRENAKKTRENAAEGGQEGKALSNALDKHFPHSLSLSLSLFLYPFPF